MTITTEEADMNRDLYAETATALRSLAAERDALRAEVERLGTACDNYFRQVSLMQMKHARHLPTLETRIARQRRALAKLYQKRHDRKAERDYLEKTALQAAQCHGRETKRADKLQVENARLRDALKNLLSYAKRNECHHENTHRGGIIWTICDDCGGKWADDQGGLKPYCEPVEITAARQALGDNQLLKSQQSFARA
jgi:hypothetical protein